MKSVNFLVAAMPFLVGCSGGDSHADNTGEGTELIDLGGAFVMPGPWVSTMSRARSRQVSTPI